MPTKLLTALAALLITIVVFAAALALLPAELVFYGFMLTLIFSATIGVLLVAIQFDVNRVIVEKSAAATSEKSKQAQSA